MWQCNGFPKNFVSVTLGVICRESLALMPTAKEFTTVEAANFLNVSPPYVVKELDAGRLPFRKVGSHRRIALDDLLAYEKKCVPFNPVHWSEWLRMPESWGWITDGRACPLHSTSRCLLTFASFRVAAVCFAGSAPRSVVDDWGGGIGWDDSESATHARGMAAHGA